MRSLATLTIILLLGGCPASSESDLQTAQTVLEIGDAVNNLQIESSELQQQLDSLRSVVAKQDTLLRQLANVAGIPVTR